MSTGIYDFVEQFAVGMTLAETRAAQSYHDRHSGS